MTEPATLRSHCVAILTNGALPAKLAAPRGGITALDDSEPGSGEGFDRDRPGAEPKAPGKGGSADLRGMGRVEAHGQAHGKFFSQPTPVDPKIELAEIDCDL